jgi:putative transposase
LSKLKRIKELDQQISKYKTIAAELNHDSQALKNFIKKEH